MNIKKVFIEHPRENFFARCPLQSHHCRLVLDAKERVKKKDTLDILLSVKLFRSICSSSPTYARIFVLHDCKARLEVAVTRMKADGQAPRISSEGGCNLE